MRERGGIDIEHLLRDAAPQVLVALVRRYRDFSAAEDATQEALFAATQQWPHDGVPDDPQAWLTQVASRRFTDQIRADTARRRRETEVAMEAGYTALESTEREDDALTLISLCCHPSLTPSSAIALTLRAVGGLTTAEIAHAFLVPEATMAQRISRAKQTIRDSDLPFRDSSSSNVLHVLYLIFNEGYTASSGNHLHRADLATEAIRLTRMLPQTNAEVIGLLALMLLTDARRAARTDPNGEPIPLDKQDRTVWNRDQIAEGVALLARVLPQGAPGPYQLQAAIAAVHDEATSAETTDWPQILALYTLLAQLSDNPVIELNRAVAVAMVYGPASALQLLAPLEKPLRGHHRLDAVRGYLQEMSGDTAAAIASFQAAATRTASLPERNYLLKQAARLRELNREKDL